MFKEDIVKAYEEALEAFLKAMKALEEEGIKTDIHIHQTGHGGCHKDVSDVNHMLFEKYFKTAKTTYKN